MGLGFGSMQHMNQSSRENRNLGKTKRTTMREKYERSVANVRQMKSMQSSPVDMRIQSRMQVFQRAETMRKVSSAVVLLIILCTMLWAVYVLFFRENRLIPPATKQPLVYVYRHGVR